MVVNRCISMAHGNVHVYAPVIFKLVHVAGVKKKTTNKQTNK